MNLEDKHLSLQFYNYLCDIVGSEEVVSNRRGIFNVKDIGENTANVTYISSGSKAEGLDLKGSDFDQMVLPNFIRVYENLDDVEYYSGKTILVMDTNDTKPGFTKLMSANKLALKIDINITKWDWFETVGEEMYISSKRFREQHFEDGMVTHGPCLSSRYGNFDTAYCLRSKEWITTAQQWIHRSRTEWPDYTLITPAIQYGVLFVPVGCKHSPNEDLQWRVSFSVIEKLLIHSFTHTQLLCYALMKIILKDLVKPKHGDLLCSYFLKTIIFWLSEEISPSEWKPINMISSFLKCLKRLVYCVEYQICLHYFIPENNLLEDRFTENKHKGLLNTLRFIYESPWMSVFETSTFQNYRLESVYWHRMVLSASELSCYNYLNMMLASYMLESFVSAVKRLVSFWFNKELCTYMLFLYAKDAFQSYDFCNMRTKNKSFYQQYKRSLCYFKISLRLFSISTWLLLASFFYKCKRFQECLVIINYCFSRCTADMIHLNFRNCLIEQTVFKDMQRRCGLLSAFKQMVIENVCFRYPFSFLPDELIPLKVEQCLFIPPVVYSYLLQFLCCYQLGDNRGQQNALHDLELTINERYFISPNENLVAIRSLSIVKSFMGYL